MLHGSQRRCIARTSRPLALTLSSPHKPLSLPSHPPAPPHWLRRARAVDVLCRPAFTALAGCLGSDAAKGDASKCATQLVAFDRCTEDF